MDALIMAVGMTLAFWLMARAGKPMARRFYLRNVAECMGIESDRVRVLCRHWGIHVHGCDHEFSTPVTCTWLSWTGVQTLARNSYLPQGTYRMDSDTRQEFLDKAWEKKRD